PLPAQSLPFWREAIKLLYPHPLLDEFPHLGYAAEQFYALATDVALDTSALAAALPGVKKLRPMLRRLDARQFTLVDYLVEFELERGQLIATTLNFQGGQGDQPLGLRDSPAARWLLWRLLTA
ncbi:MAG: glycoside hydrolase, partial [Anaerolineae bacterium]|nr:glycoside hydrolase [Anaerolineae bacterium]